MITSFFMVKACRFTPLLIMLMVALMILVPKSGAQSSNVNPLCVSQFALANHACAFLPPDPEDRDDNDDEDDDDDHGEDDSANHGHGHGHGHSDGQVHSHGHVQHNSSGHHHGHRRRRHHRRHDAVRECCRWVRAIDERCVCDLLVRLPVFLSRPVHEFTVVVHDECEIDFKCPGRLMPGR